MMVLILFWRIVVIYEKVMGCTILLSYLFLVKLVMLICLFIFYRVLGLRCCSKDTCRIEFRFIVFGDVNNDIYLSLVISIHSDWLMLKVSLILYEASFSSYSSCCPSLLAFSLSYWNRLPLLILVYITVEYIFFEDLLLLLLLHIIRRRKLLKVRNLIKIFSFCTNLSRSSIHKSTNITPILHIS